MTDAGDGSAVDDDNLLLELEAVAADLGDDADDRRPGDGRAAPPGRSSDDAELEEHERDLLRFGSDDVTVEQVAELWSDDSDAERALLREIDAQDDTDDVSFDLDALVEDDLDSRARRSDSSDEFDISDLRDLADLAAESDGEEGAAPGDTADDADDGFKLVFGDRDDRESDPDAPSTEAAAGVGDRPALDPAARRRLGRLGPRTRDR